MKKNTDFKYSLVCILFSLVFLLWLIPAYTPKSTIKGDLASAVLPNIMMGIILICGVVMLVKSLLTPKGEEVAQKADAVRPGRLAAVLILLLAYLLALNYVGFYVTTAAALPLALRYFNPGLRWWRIACGTAVLLVFVFLLFELGLAVKMPRGVLL